MAALDIISSIKNYCLFSPIIFWPSFDAYLVSNEIISVQPLKKRNVYPSPFITPPLHIPKSLKDLGMWRRDKRFETQNDHPKARQNVKFTFYYTM